MRKPHDTTPSEKAAVLRETDNITVATLRVLCKEDAFPKRSRWLIAQPIADLINKFHSAVMTANGIKVQSHVEFVERHKWQTNAIAYLYAANVKMNLAMTVLNINADRLSSWADRFNNAQLNGKCFPHLMVKQERRCIHGRGADCRAFLPVRCFGLQHQKQRPSDSS